MSKYGYSDYHYQVTKRHFPSPVSAKDVRTTKPEEVPSGLKIYQGYSFPNGEGVHFIFILLLFTYSTKPPSLKSSNRKPSSISLAASS